MGDFDGTMAKVIFSSGTTKHILDHAYHVRGCRLCLVLALDVLQSTGPIDVGAVYGDVVQRTHYIKVEE